MDPGVALAQMRRAQPAYRRFEQVFAAHPRLPIVFEELIENQRPGSLEDMVTNYDRAPRTLADFG